MENCKGDILLVGEGDFSFSVAFARKLKGRPDTRVISTCLPPHDDLYAAHGGAKENISNIEQLGVTVLYEVDATKLEDCANLKQMQFDYVIFNFPHTGGKSNIKNNRKLLRSFFASAVKKIKADGSLLVSLARGQGGTPADKPVREWHDSWQVVAMAAYSDLIMCGMKAFLPSDWIEYSSTGFRGMDRQFFTGGAFTYHFKLAAALKVASKDGVEDPVQCCIDGQIVLVNSYIASKINRKLLHDKDHPLAKLCKLTVNLIKSNFGNNDLVTDLGYAKSRLIQQQSNKTELADNENARIGDSNKESEYGESNIAEDPHLKINGANISSVDNQDPTIEDIKLARQNNVSLYYPVLSHSDHINTSQNLALRTDVLDCGKVLEVIGEGKSCVAYGDVYKRTWIDGNTLPVQHECVFVTPQLDKTVLKEKVKSVIEEILPKCSVFINEDKENLPNFGEKVCLDWCVEIGYKSENVFHTLSCNQVGAKGPPLQKRDNVKQTKFSKIVSYAGTINSNVLFGLSNIDSLNVVVFNLDFLAQVKYDIPDQRLLWSENPEFISQFSSDGCDASNSEDISYQPLSYYPPLWRHDLSFWERDDELFNEQRFMDMVRNIAGDALNEVILMNVWRDPDTNKLSKCYRQIYQSHDSPLSHQKAHDFQNAIRLNVEKEFRVELR